MGEAIIEVKNLSKNYIISHENGRGANDSLREVIAHTANRIFSPKKYKPTQHTSETFSALNDISFTVERGNRVGILGSNGAGKSTLLKILSRIIEPTQGEVKVNGHVVSLLEVGTGFHPELSGRENVFLNGVILGMSRAEIRKKFDEIVAFAEVEKFLDTPVKKYSSGMYMRLAFAVAAHLEPEIFIIDEVLAVGDARFQKKCLAKMEEISRQDNRTVLFVSHNIESVRTFCTSGIYLNSGKLVIQGDIETVANKYASMNNGRLTTFMPNSHKSIYFNSFALNKSTVVFNEALILNCEVISNTVADHYIIGLTIVNNFDGKIGTNLLWSKKKLIRGSNSIDIKVPIKHMVPGRYKIIIAIALDEKLDNEDVVIDYPLFTIEADEEHQQLFNMWNPSWGGSILPNAEIL